MAELGRPSILRNRIKNIFQTYEETVSTFLKEDQFEEQSKENKRNDYNSNGNYRNINFTLRKDNLFDYEFQNKSKWNKRLYDYEKHEYNGRINEYDTRDICINNMFYYDDMIEYVSNKECLLVENYNSVIYENCEKKINVLLANKGLPDGLIEVQIKGKDNFLISCSYSKNILSFFCPQLEEGVYQLTFFLNKNRIYIKLLRNNTGLKEISNSLPFHVIKINDFASSLRPIKGNLTHKKKKYELSKTNNANTNKELLKIYNSTYKEYKKYENKRNSQIMVGNNYKLENTNELDFYSFLKCYKDQFVNHTFKKNVKNENGIIQDKNRSIIDCTNNMNFMCPLNLEQNVEQNRIPIMYKKLLYDNCIYENKKIIMHFHNNIFELEPFKVLSVHVFTKNELKDGYSIFAFNIIPLAKKFKEASVNKILSDVLGFPFKNENSTYNKNVLKEMKDLNNNINENITINNKDGEDKNDNIHGSSNSNNNNNNNNIEKIQNFMSSLYMFQSDETNCADIRLWKYHETFTCRKNQRAENFYINKEDCCADIKSPVPPELINNKNIFMKYSEGIKIADNISIFFESWNEEVMPIKQFIELFNSELPLKKIQHICSIIKNVKDDYLLFDESIIKSDQENYENYENAGNNTSTKKSKLSNEQNSEKKIKKGKELLDHLLNTFVSFVLVIDNKIYNSVVPISKFLLVFIINFWMHFVSVRKQII